MLSDPKPKRSFCSSKYKTAVGDQLEMRSDDALLFFFFYPVFALKVPLSEKHRRLSAALHVGPFALG